MKLDKPSGSKYSPEQNAERRRKWLDSLSPEKLAQLKDKNRAYLKEYHKNNYEKKVRERISKPLPTKKVCTRCQVEKLASEFRIRIEKRHKVHSEYLNNKCCKCESENQLEIYRRTKDKNREKNAAKARDYYAANKEKIKPKARVYRQKEESKERRKEYYYENHDKILKQHHNVCKRAQAELRDWYVVGKIAQKEHSAIREIVKNDKELIEIKRLQITLKRLTNERNNRK